MSPKGVPNSGKRNMSRRPLSAGKRGPVKKYVTQRAAPKARRTAARVEFAPVRRAKRKAAPATRTSAKSVVMEKFQELAVSMNELKHLQHRALNTIVDIQKAAFTDQFRNYYLKSGGERGPKEFMEMFSSTVALLLITEADLWREIEQYAGAASTNGGDSEKQEMPASQMEASQESRQDSIDIL